MSTDLGFATNDFLFRKSIRVDREPFLERAYSIATLASYEAEADARLWVERTTRVDDRPYADELDVGTPIRPTRRAIRMEWADPLPAVQDTEWPGYWDWTVVRDPAWQALRHRCEHRDTDPERVEPDEPQPPNEGDAVTVKELALRLGVSIQTVYAWAHRGRTPRPFRVGPKRSRIRFRAADVAEWLRSEDDDNERASWWNDCGVVA